MTVAPPLRFDINSQPATFFADRSLAIMNVSPERQEAAWEVIKYITSPEVSARWNADQGFLAATFSSFQHPIYQDLVARQPNIQLWAEYFQVPFAPPFPSHLYTTDLYTTIVQARGPLIRGEEPVEAFIANLEPRVNQFVQEYLSNR